MPAFCSAENRHQGSPGFDSFVSKLFIYKYEYSSLLGYQFVMQELIHLLYGVPSVSVLCEVTSLFVIVDCVLILVETLAALAELHETLELLLVSVEAPVLSEFVEQSLSRHEHLLLNQKLGNLENERGRASLEFEQLSDRLQGLHRLLTELKRVEGQVSVNFAIFRLIKVGLNKRLFSIRKKIVFQTRDSQTEPAQCCLSVQVQRHLEQRLSVCKLVLRQFQIGQAHPVLKTPLLLI